MKRMLETKRTAAAIAALLGSILPAQAGLKLEATQGTEDVLVIERVEMPVLQKE